MYHSAVKAIDLGGRCVHLDPARELALHERVLLLGEPADNLPPLEVRLPVQVARVNVAHAVRIARLEQQDVRRDGFVVGQMDQVTHAHILPQDLLVALGFTVEK